MKEDQILDSEFEELEKKPLSLMALAVTLVGIGGFVGATTNLVNGKVSQDYFHNIMGWSDYIWLNAIAQGLVEGLIYGVIFSLIYTVGFALITSVEADWKFMKRQLKRILIVIYGSWIAGGILAIILAFVFPEAYDQAIYDVPDDTVPRIGYAWVGGSIIGGILGGVVSIIWGLLKTHRDWKKEMQIL